jgi:hypothetical protein
VVEKQSFDSLWVGTELHGKDRGIPKSSELMKLELGAAERTEFPTDIEGPLHRATADSLAGGIWLLRGEWSLRNT